jgi:hypothetical protein
MKTYHHIGIPTQTQQKNETYLENLRVYVSGYEESPYGVEWMRFEPDSPLPENSPSKGVRVAFIIHNGAPIEFIEIKKIQVQT